MKDQPRLEEAEPDGKLDSDRMGTGFTPYHSTWGRDFVFQPTLSAQSSTESKVTANPAAADEGDEKQGVAVRQRTPQPNEAIASKQLQSGNGRAKLLVFDQATNSRVNDLMDSIASREKEYNHNNMWFAEEEELFELLRAHKVSYGEISKASAELCKQEIQKKTFITPLTARTSQHYITRHSARGSEAYVRRKTMKKSLDSEGH
ncbi:hypothetical protein C8A03DRAFT_29009 [Achaetomium macrosporum]|uniref:Uncharacterized protein n=1 Tax=Achaetomium macrosporum TaxID=79813 RepID=A0AAN7HJV3_9PEZI|nr:hypothetical protein C8A03DRAFT_29009 [Achaetomium macrosporum]